MVKPEWGAKRVCPNCNARFYDLEKDPVTCPMCESTFPLEDLLKVRKTRVTKAEAKKAAKKTATPKPDDDDDTIIDDDDDSENIDILGDDDDLADFSDDDTLLDDDDDDSTENLEGFQVDSDGDEEET